MFLLYLLILCCLVVQSIFILCWGIIGSGWIVECFVYLLKIYSWQQVVVVVFCSQVKVDWVVVEWGIFQVYGQVEEMLVCLDIDVVYIVMLYNYYFFDGMQVLKVGKYVLIEKFFVFNFGEGCELQVEVVCQEKLVLEVMWCDYVLKYDVICQLLEDGVFGDLYILLVDYGEYFICDYCIFNVDFVGGLMMDFGSYVILFVLMVGGMLQEIVVCGSVMVEGLNGQMLMLFSWQNGMQGLLNIILFSNMLGGVVVVGCQVILMIDGQFYVFGGFMFVVSQGGQVLCWEELCNCYDQLFWQVEYFVWCIGQGVQDLLLWLFSWVLQNLQVMDEVWCQVGVVFNEEC